ncbi:MAG: hypothetical protein RLY89_1665, partial [Bacteroidota bacterium]
REVGEVQRSRQSQGEHPPIFKK